MESARYRECLAADFARLRMAAVSAPVDRPVPHCPGWHMTDLVGHLADVYLHKVESMRLGRFPDPWPPEPTGEAPLARLDRAFAGLLAELDARPPAERTAHWFEPDPTVGCLLRRMAHETVVHRVDAEGAAGGPVTPIPHDLALDGVDEVLEVVLGFLSRKWPEAFADLPADGDCPPVRVQAADRGWLVTPTAKGVTVTAGGSGPVAATVAGRPQPMLLWLWGRGGDATVTTTGDPAALTRLRGLLRDAAQ
jgi:uncharacterized protein (TIGR03083 family)